MHTCRSNAQHHPRRGQGRTGQPARAAPHALDVAADALPALLELLKGRAGFVHLSAISCVDWPADDQFELVYHLWSYELNALVSVHTDRARPRRVYVSVYDIYHPAGFFERDIHEMYGVFSRVPPTWRSSS